MSNEQQQGGALVSPAKRFNQYLTQHKGQLAMALPKHLNADRMVRLALTAFSSNAKLAECEPRSIFASVVLSSQIGLEIGVLGQGFIVPYFNNKSGRFEAQFVPGWMGILDLVQRTGRANAWTGAVFNGDDFDYALGDRPFVQHKPCGEDDPDAMTHVYAIGKVNGIDQPIIEVWPIKRVWRHRDRYNKVGKAHYSFKQPEMYARKVPLLQVCKYLPKSVELTAAFAAETAHEHGTGMTFDGEFVTVDTGDHGDAGDSGNSSAASRDERKNGNDLPAMSDDEFDAKLKGWVPLIQSGKKTAAAIIASAKTKNALTEQQIDTINTYTSEGSNADA